MKIESETLLDGFRMATKCEWCGRRISVAEPHHVFTKGMGGGGRLDIPCNLVALGGAFECSCHRSHHDGHAPLTCDLLALVAARLGTLQKDIEAEIHRARRLPKGSIYTCPWTGFTWQAPLKKRRA